MERLRGNDCSLRRPDRPKQAGRSPVGQSGTRACNSETKSVPPPRRPGRESETDRRGRAWVSVRRARYHGPSMTPRGGGRGRRVGWLLTVAACLAVLGARSGTTGASAAAAGETPRPVILVGLDGADWQAIEPLAEAGRLPSFARLRAAGRTGVLKATPPLLSPILWTTIATGRRPEDHQVLDFMVDLPAGGQAPTGVSQRRVAALWNILSARGRQVAVVGWWATAPAENVRGVVVSDRVTPHLLQESRALPHGAISPPSEGARLASASCGPRLRRADVLPYLDLPGEWEGRGRRSMSGGPSLPRPVAPDGRRGGDPHLRRDGGGPSRLRRARRCSCTSRIDSLLAVKEGARQGVIERGLPGRGRSPVAARGAVAIRAWIVVLRPRLPPVEGGLSRGPGRAHRPGRRVAPAVRHRGRDRGRRPGGQAAAVSGGRRGRRDDRPGRRRPDAPARAGPADEPRDARPRRDRAAPARGRVGRWRASQLRAFAPGPPLRPIPRRSNG
jgi:hypothetical protein